MTECSNCGFWLYKFPGEFGLCTNGIIAEKLCPALGGTLRTRPVYSCPFGGVRTSRMWPDTAEGDRDEKVQH